MKRAGVNFLKSWLDAGLGFIYPEICQLCGAERATAPDGYVGAQCRGKVRFIKPPFCERCGLPYAGEITTTFECSNCREMDLRFLRARAAVAANDLVLEVIHRYKYQRALWFEPFLGDLLQRQAVPALGRERWDLIVPVPLYSLKKREREFNQAERLAARLGAATGIAVESRLLQRVVATRTQTRLSRSERVGNVRQAFALRTNGCVTDKRIILVDDVLTTGATTSACAGALKAAGAEEVCVWTVARGL
jgi:competence protein ComFC